MDKIIFHRSVYYNRLSKLLLWPIVGLVSLVFVVTVSLYFVLNSYYLPSIYSAIDQSVSAEVLRLIEAGYFKISGTLFVWIGVLLLLNLLLIYVVWNVKKFLIELNQSVEK